MRTERGTETPIIIKITASKPTLKDITVDSSTLYLNVNKEAIT